jgi:pimeloyl-ACP methyl ester carboxylesterase
MQIWETLGSKYSLLAFDRPGFGLSSRPSRGEWKENPYTNEFSMQLVDRFIKEFGIQKFVLIAHSTGSNLALEIASKLSDRAMAMILVSPSDGLPDFVRTIIKTKLGRAVIIQLVKSELGQVAIQRAWHDPSSISQDIQERYQAALHLPKWSESLWEMTRVKNKSMISSASRLKEYQRVLFVYGEDDKLVSFTETEQLLDILPLSELIDLSECGHLPQEEKPEKFCSTVINFIDQIPASHEAHK